MYITAELLLLLKAQEKADLSSKKEGGISCKRELTQLH